MQNQTVVVELLLDRDFAEQEARKRLLDLEQQYDSIEEPIHFDSIPGAYKLEDHDNAIIAEQKRTIEGEYEMICIALGYPNRRIFPVEGRTLI